MSGSPTSVWQSSKTGTTCRYRASWWERSDTWHPSGSEESRIGAATSTRSGQHSTNCWLCGRRSKVPTRSGWSSCIRTDIAGCRRRQLERDIPRDLETIVLKALAKDPKDRFGSAGELADELRRFVEGRPIRSRPVSVVEQLWRWCKRDPGWLGRISPRPCSSRSWRWFRGGGCFLPQLGQSFTGTRPGRSRIERGRSDAALLDARWRAVDAYTSQARAGGSAAGSASDLKASRPWARP